MAYQNPLKPGMLPANETKNRRTHTSKQFLMPSLGPGKRITRAHIGHIHHFDKLLTSPRFREIDTTVNIGGGGFESLAASYHALNPLFADAMFQFRDLYGPKDLTYGLQPVSFREEGAGPATDVAHVQGSIVTHRKWTDRAVRYPNAYGALGHLLFVHRNNGLDHRVRIPTNPGFTGNLLLTWELDLSQIPGAQIEIRERGQSPRIWDQQTTETFRGTFWVGDGTVWTRLGPFRVWDSSVGKTDRESLRRIPCRLRRQGNRLLFTKVVPASFLNDPETVYPVVTDATSSFFSGAGDGWVSGLNANWDTCHDLATGSQAQDGADLFVDMRHQGGGDYDIKRVFVPVDTSGLPDGDVISAADLNLDAKQAAGNDDNDGQDYLTIVQTSAASTASLITADFNQCGDSVDDPTEGIDNGDRVDFSTIAGAGYFSIDLNATGLGWINKTGFTELGLREGHDVEDDVITGSPPVSNNVTLYDSEEAGTGSDPYLDVTHASAGIALPVGSLSMMGVGR